MKGIFEIYAPPAGSLLESLELATVVEYTEAGICEQVPPGEEVPEDADIVSVSLYAKLPGQGPDCIGDFATVEAARETIRQIAGHLTPLPRR